MNENATQVAVLPTDVVFDEIKQHWTKWAEAVGAKKYVVGISGGVDSSTVAALACKIFGKDSVVGVLMPCDEQADIVDSWQLVQHLGIKSVTINIGDMFADLKCKLDNNCIEINDQAKTNAPARLRMTTLYAVAQSLGAFVLNTCNFSETCVGNDTRWGDQCGDYAPIKMLTKGEVVDLALWLGVPANLAKKTPVDGLQPLTDEERLGVTYNEIDAVIRNKNPDAVDIVAAALVTKKYHENKFKIKGIFIEGPEFKQLVNTFLDGTYN